MIEAKNGNEASNVVPIEKIFPISFAGTIFDILFLIPRYE